MDSSTAQEGIISFPEWIDTLGLTLQEFRVYFHIQKVIQTEGVFIEDPQKTAIVCGLTEEETVRAIISLKYMLHSIGEYPEGSF